ncbi:hypothetical protein E2C01_058709 [Portunus trituberculatus]|uniref:Uncharacterized protein n=1 Tax=Portunus trituberculatus TaxID=210409 RepID=A0A5B7GX73_PORTR|nr:hypothetical protein [Portunus trituberculatus]
MLLLIVSIAESIDLGQVKESKISTGAHDRESFKDCSAMSAPMVSVQPSATPSVSDQASCDDDALTIQSSSNIVIAVPHGPTVAKSTMGPYSRHPVPGRNSEDSHHSPVGQRVGSIDSARLNSRCLLVH